MPGDGRVYRNFPVGPTGCVTGRIERVVLCKRGLTRSSCIRLRQHWPTDCLGSASK